MSKTVFDHGEYSSEHNAQICILKILLISLGWVFIAVHWLSPVVAIGGCSLIVTHGFLFMVASLGVEHGL